MYDEYTYTVFNSPIGNSTEKKVNTAMFPLLGTDRLDVW